MTYDPDDRVLIGVINRPRDLAVLRAEGWYRIPYERMPLGVQADVLGVYLSKVVNRRGGAVCWYGRVVGVELVYRRWLLPDEHDHPRADEVYYRLALGNLTEKVPPIRNSSGRRVHFIRTTWAHFERAGQLQDLYRPLPSE
ncbi:MAG: hypothetical protein MUC99_03685 [Anaerolineae bacterium]|jgi:hypothetical protein|nr:hypothetical protein [Anaerolineae bacterium]